MSLYLKDNEKIDNAVVKVLLNAKYDHNKLKEEYRSLIAS